jgi:hypothetical protein
MCSVMERRPGLQVVFLLNTNQDDMYNALPAARLGRKRLANGRGTSPNLETPLFARKQKAHAGQ